MKHHRETSSTTARPPAADPDRETIRRFNDFCETHDPRALAERVEPVNVAKTLAHVARIELWFRHYCAGLREGRVQ